MIKERKICTSSAVEESCMVQLIHTFPWHVEHMEMYSKPEIMTLIPISYYQCGYISVSSHIQLSLGVGALESLDENVIIVFPVITFTFIYAGCDHRLLHRLICQNIPFTFTLIYTGCNHRLFHCLICRNIPQIEHPHLGKKPFFPDNGVLSRGHFAKF